MQVFIIQSWPGGIVQAVLSDGDVALAVALKKNDRFQTHTVTMREVDCAEDS